jgi:hypothetical protein
VNNRTAAAEALRAKRVDLVFTGPAEYVVMRARTDAVPVIALQRVDYYPNVVARADSGITEVAQLKGKRVAFGSIGSTSRHLGPMQLLADLGLDPRQDIQATHVNSNIGFEALKRGDVAAMGMNYTDFQKLRERDPLTPYFVLARGRDLPLDLILAGSHVDKGVVGKVRKAIADNAPEMAKAILAGEGENVKFKGMTSAPAVRGCACAQARAASAAARPGRVRVPAPQPGAAPAGAVERAAWGARAARTVEAFEPSHQRTKSPKPRFVLEGLRTINPKGYTVRARTLHSAARRVRLSAFQPG